MNAPDAIENYDSYEALLHAITPEVHEQLRRAIELGKWPNGDRLTSEQREHCLQAVIAWEAKHLPEEERVGYIDRTNLRKQHCDA